MMTGILPTPTRYIDFLATVDEDTPKAMTLPQFFKENGYTNLANGKVLHTETDAAERSWSRPVQKSSLPRLGDSEAAASQHKQQKKGKGLFYQSLDVADSAYDDGVTAERTIADLRRLREEGKPFFLACGFIKPHLPFYAPKKYWDLYDEASLPLASNRFPPRNARRMVNGSLEYQTYDLGGFDDQSDAFHRKMRHGYFACTSYVDHLVGEVLEELETLGLSENTIVVLWGDHGWHLGEHSFWGKHNTLHNAIRIPLIVRAPGKPGGLRSQALVQSVDIFPTLCSLAGLAAPSSVQGKSFAALLDEPEREHNSAIYTRFKDADAVVTSRFTYSRIAKKNAELLFDLAKDPQENKNLAGDEGSLPTLQEMRKKLDALMKEAEAATW